MSVLVGKLGEMYKLLVHYGMEAVFMAMIIAARSKRQLRELHDAQPANCRLLRQDYLELEAAWDQLYPQGYEAGADAQTLACVLDVLRKVYQKYRGRGDLIHYYLLRLDHDGQEKVSVRIAIGIHSTVFPCPQRKGHGEEHFTTTLFGHEFRIGFKLTEDGRHIVVWFMIWENDLTEPLVYALLNKLPKFQISSAYRVSSSGGEEVGVCYILDREGFEEHIVLEDGEGEGVTVGGQCHIAQEGFVPEVLRRLQTMGIPIKEILPIMVAERRD